MKEELEEFLRKINNGKLNKAQKKLADMLGVSEPSVSNWLAGKTNMSDDNIIKLAKITNKTPKEIQKIFAVNSNIGNNITITDSIKDKEIELLKEKNRRLELEIELLKLKRKNG